MTAIAPSSPLAPAERATIVAARVRHARRRALQTAGAGLACGILVGICLTLCGLWITATR